MPRFSVSQLRSGEGWILTRLDNVGPEVLAGEMADLLTGPLLVASEEFETWTPPGGEQVEANLYAFIGEPARRMLADHERWSAKGAIFAGVERLPDEDARRKWIPQALRPWDCERLRATFYGQSGKRYAHRGLWFAKETERRRFVEAGVAKLLKDAGLRLPNGDATLVLELPTDSTFECELKASGRGEGFKLRRDFPSRNVTRTWFVRRGAWEAEEKRLRRTKAHGLRERALRTLASGAILLVSLPVFALVGVVAVVTKLTGASSPTSGTTVGRRIR